MGTARAPVTGSGCCPACSASVSGRRNLASAMTTSLQRVTLRLEETRGCRGVALLGLNLVLDTRDLGLEGRDVFLELLDRHRIEIPGCRLLLAGVEIVEVKGHGVSPRKRLWDTYHRPLCSERPSMSALPATMKCVEISKPGGPEVLVPAT